MDSGKRKDLSARLAVILAGVGLLKAGHSDAPHAAAVIEEFLKENPIDPPEPEEAWKRG